MVLSLALLCVGAAAQQVAPVIEGSASMLQLSTEQVEPVMVPKAALQPEQPAAATQQVVEDGAMIETERSQRDSVPALLPPLKSKLPARAHKRAVRGWGISPTRPRRVQQRLPAARLTGAASTLTRANVRCVLCQFIVQKLKASLTAPKVKVSLLETDAAESDNAASASLIEAFSFANAEQKSRVESLVEASATADAAASALPTLFDNGSDKARRFRYTDVLSSRASRARFTQVRHGTGVEAEAQRAAYLKLYSTLYASFEGLCATRMPLAYLPYCNDMLKSYRYFAQGINFNDRPDQICMNGNFCDHRAYVRAITHTAYTREPGDA